MMYPFEIEVLIHQRPNMLDDNLEYYLHRGQNVLRNLFIHEIEDTHVEAIEFWFPERWLNIVQERSLFDRLAKYYTKLKSVRIMTQSVYIIQCTPPGSARIVRSSELTKYAHANGKLPGECVSGTTAFTVGGVSDMSKLQVM